MNKLSSFELECLHKLSNAQHYSDGELVDALRNNSVRGLIGLCVKETSLGEVKDIIDTTDWSSVG